MKMEEVHPSKALVTIYQTTWHQVPKDHNLQLTTKLVKMIFSRMLPFSRTHFQICFPSFTLQCFIIVTKQHTSPQLSLLSMRFIGKFPDCYCCNCLGERRWEGRPRSHFRKPIASVFHVTPRCEHTLFLHDCFFDFVFHFVCDG
jgi:hypothetical protein